MAGCDRTSRNHDRVMEAVVNIKKLQPNAKVEGMVLNLSSFSSINQFVAEVKSKYPKVDILVNNAGLGMIPFAKTEQGFEPTLGTNVMGTTYLTTSLLPLIAASPAGRVVFLGALPVNMVKQKGVDGHINDVGGESLTSCTFETYGVSKLYTCLYAYELQKRLAAHDNEAYNNIEIYGADPGVVKTTFHGKLEGGLFKFVMGIAESIMGVDTDTGALSSIYCATVSGVSLSMRGGVFTAGPKVAPFKWETKAYNEQNSARVFDAINAATTAKGFRAFV
eukprot:gene35046-43213_t